MKFRWSPAWNFEVSPKLNCFPSQKPFYNRKLCFCLCFYDIFLLEGPNSVLATPISSQNLNATKIISESRKRFKITDRTKKKTIKMQTSDSCQSKQIKRLSDKQHRITGQQNFHWKSLTSTYFFATATVDSFLLSHKQYFPFHFIWLKKRRTPKQKISTDKIKINKENANEIK